MHNDALRKKRKKEKERRKKSFEGCLSSLINVLHSRWLAEVSVDMHKAWQQSTSANCAAPLPMSCNEDSNSSAEPMNLVRSGQNNIRRAPSEEWTQAEVWDTAWKLVPIPILLDFRKYTDGVWWGWWRRGFTFQRLQSCANHDTHDPILCRMSGLGRQSWYKMAKIGRR